MFRNTARSLCAASVLGVAVSAMFIAGPQERSVGTAEGAAGDDLVIVGEAFYASPMPAAKPLPTQTSTTAISACADTAFSASGWRLGRSYGWYYNPSGAPAAVSSTALTAISNGTQALVRGSNRCGKVVSLSSSHQYLGGTTATAQIGPDAKCLGNDGRSVTGWGTLPTGMLGYACVTYRASSGAVVASDMMLNKSVQWFTTKPTTCSNAYDVQSVVVHERGHTAGLGHVPQDTSAAQTMSPRTLACDTSKRLLGSGDLAGMTKLYGAA